jgi:dihydrofolate reductase
MKIILFMAMSLNGIIAKENGSEDFLSDINWITFEKMVKKVKCIIIGRKTYEAVMKWSNYNYDSINGLNKIIVSKSNNIKLGKDSFVVSSPKEAIKLANSMGFKEIILTGGSKLNTSFIQEDLIDEIILNIDAVLIGKGIKLFFEEDFEKKLKLESSKKLSENIIQLHYLLNK